LNGFFFLAAGKGGGGGATGLLLIGETETDCSATAQRLKHFE